MATKAKVRANTAKNKGRKPPPERTWWKPGQSGNPKGRPREGESWTAIIKKIGDMSGPQLAEHFSIYAAQLRKLGPVTMKEAVVIRAYMQLAFEASGSLFNALVDRAEGKVSQPLDVSWRDDLMKQGVDPDAILEKLVNEFVKMARGSSGGGMAGGEAPPRSATVPDASAE